MHKPASLERGAELDLAAIETKVRLEEGYVRDGHVARTLVRQPDLRVVLLVLRAGARIAEHRVHASAAIHTLRGHVRLRLPERTVELPAGRLLVLVRELPHDVEALADSAVLLTLGWNEKA